VADKRSRKPPAGQRPAHAECPTFFWEEKTMVVRRSNSKFGDGRVRCEVHEDCQDRIAGVASKIANIQEFLAISAPVLEVSG